MFDMLNPPVHLENSIKHTSTILGELGTKQNKMALQYTGDFEASIR